MEGRIKLFGVYLSPNLEVKPKEVLDLNVGTLSNCNTKAPSPPLMEVKDSGLKEIKLFGVVIRIGDAEPPAVKPKIKHPRLIQPDHQPLPERYRHFIISKGADVGTLKLILRKRLYPTDFDRYHARLSLPRKQIEETFLRPEEERFIEKTVQIGNRKLKNKIDVMVVDPSCLEMRTMKITKWNFDESKKKNSWWLALTNDWIKLLKDNHLVVEDAIQVWSFRHIDGHLGFIIHKVEMDVEPSNADDNDRATKRMKATH